MNPLGDYLKAKEEAKNAKDFFERQKWEKRAQQALDAENALDTNSGDWNKLIKKLTNILEDDLSSDNEDTHLADPEDQENLPKSTTMVMMTKKMAKKIETDKSWLRECSNFLEIAQQEQIQEVTDTLRENEAAAKARLARLHDKRKLAADKIEYYRRGKMELLKRQLGLIEKWRTKKRLFANLRLEDQLKNRNNELLTTDWSKIVDDYVKVTLRMRLAQLKIDKWELFANVPDYPSPDELIRTEAKNKKIEEKSNEIIKDL